ncbi:transcriptional regulator [Pilimelia terevasa]|uniref:Transcriptional regulator n=1 Tax=Pilimelia terevasa TaxID=53372 RepID=A0A8J3BNE7_9ACTN|nr:helix-turn-helix transcriptional regulator [Pilimelia terevasa]GGK27140.1 transcriptional regulator [Pilimelia terevasa]
MTTSSTDDARRSLGIRLRDVRKDAGLTGKQLAELSGINNSRISRIEHGGATPTEENVTAWLTACGAQAQHGEIIATLRAVEEAYSEWRTRIRSGMRGAYRPIAIYQDVQAFRIHEPTLIPGAFQTPAYARAIVSFWQDFYAAPDDLDEAVAHRMRRAEAILGRRVAAVVGEAALRLRYTSEDAHEEQLLRLVESMRRPNVSLGLVPLGARLPGILSAGFIMYDDRVVYLETPTAEVAVRRPSEVAQYARLFGLFQAQSLYGRDARRLVLNAIGDLT